MMIKLILITVFLLASAAKDVAANGLGSTACSPYSVSTVTLHKTLSLLDSPHPPRLGLYTICDDPCGRAALPSATTMGILFDVISGSSSLAAKHAVIEGLSGECGARGISTPEQRQTLKALAKSKDQTLADFSTIALMRYGPASDYTPLRDIVRRGKSPAARAALETLDNRNQLDKSLVEDALSKGDVDTRIALVQRLSNRHLLPDWFNRLMADPEVKVRKAAIRNARSEDLISRGLSDADPEIRKIAERRLGRRPKNPK